MDTTTQIKTAGPLVSILMLTYNRAAYIGAAIDSILAQTYQNFELVIIDDGSTDTTKDILVAYTDARITIVSHPENRGLCVRRNESIQHARGKYTAILDSDDMWTDTSKLAEQVDYLEQHPDCAVIGTFLTLIDEHGNKIGSDQYGTSDQDIRKHFLVRNQFAHSSVVMRTHLAKQVGGYRNTDLDEDFDLLLQLGVVGTLANIPKYMTAYRIHTGSFNPERTRMAWAVLAVIKKHKHSYPNYYKALAKAYLRIWYRYWLG